MYSVVVKLKCSEFTFSILTGLHSVLYLVPNTATGQETYRMEEMYNHKPYYLHINLNHLQCLSCIITSGSHLIVFQPIQSTHWMLSMADDCACMCIAWGNWAYLHTLYKYVDTNELIIMILEHTIWGLKGNKEVTSVHFTTTTITDYNFVPNLLEHRPV